MKTTDLFITSSKKLNESLAKTFGKRINFEQFELEQLHDARNKLRTQVSQIRGQSGFNENLENDAFLEAQWMLDAINAEIEERDEHIIDADVEEGRMSEIDIDLQMLAREEDEDQLIDALRGDMGTGVADALNDMMEELKDELASKGMNDVMRDDDKMIEMLMDKLVAEYGDDDDFDDEGGETDDDYALKSAGFGSDEDYGDFGRDENVQYEDRVDEKAVSKAQQRAAGIALAAKRKGKTPPGKGAAAEMAKMSTKELEKYAGTKHKNLPAKKDESVQRGDKMTRLREGDYYYDHDDERSGSTGAIMRSNTPVYDKLVKAITKENPNIKMAKDLVDYYGDEIEDVIARLYAEGRANKAPKSQRAAMMLEKALKKQTSESIVREGEVQQASAIVTAKTMVDRVGRWIEELSGMENETLLQLGDSIRDEMGQEQAKAFIEQTAPAIQSALETLKGTRDTLSTSVRSLASGEQPADMLGAEPALGGDEEMGPAEPDMMNTGEEPAGDEFAAAEPAAGGMEAPGREQRESIERQNRLLKVLAG